MDDEPWDLRSLAAGYSTGLKTPAHSHDWGQLVYAVSGTLLVETEGLAWTIPSTRALWVPPNLTHRLTALVPVALRTLYLSPGRSAGLPGEARALEVSILLRSLILHAVELGPMDPAHPPHERLVGVIVDQLAASAALPLSIPMPVDPRAAAVAGRVCGDPSEPVELDCLAREAGVGERTLQRLFKRETGMTFSDWRRRARLLHGLSALSSGAPVTTAAFDAGYASPSAFIGAFKTMFGVSPGQFRKRGGSEPKSKVLPPSRGKVAPQGSDGGPR